MGGWTDGSMPSQERETVSPQPTHQTSVFVSISALVFSTHGWSCLTSWNVETLQNKRRSLTTTDVFPSTTEFYLSMTDIWHILVVYAIINSQFCCVPLRYSLCVCVCVCVCVCGHVYVVYEDTNCIMTWVWHGYYKEKVIYEDIFSVPII